MFLTTSLEYAYLSSTISERSAAFGGDLSKFVPRLRMQRRELGQKEKQKNKESVL